MCELWVGPRDWARCMQGFTRQNILYPTHVQVCNCTQTGEKPSELLHKTQSMELWLELQLSDAIRWWIYSKGCVFGDSQVSVCKPSLVWSPGEVAGRWAVSIAGKQLGAATWRATQTKGSQNEGDARGRVSWQLKGRTCDYTFDSNHWVDRAALSSVVILPAAGFPVMSTAIRIEQGINSYPDAPLSWELALIRTSWGRVALARRALLSPGCSHQARSLGIYSQALISQMITFQISNVSLL